MDETYSGRVAAEILASLAGVGLRQARAVLDSGLAGTPRVERGTHLFPGHALQKLLDRTVIDVDDPAACSGYLILRRQASATLCWRDRADALATGWDISAVSMLPVQLAVRDAASRAERPVVVLGTVGGFVVTAARLVEARSIHGRRWSTDLVLEPLPSTWAWLESSRVAADVGRSWSWHAPLG